MASKSDDSSNNDLDDKHNSKRRKRDSSSEHEVKKRKRDSSRDKKSHKKKEKKEKKRSSRRKRDDSQEKSKKSRHSKKRDSSSSSDDSVNDDSPKKKQLAKEVLEITKHLKNIVDAPNDHTSLAQKYDYRDINQPLKKDEKKKKTSRWGNEEEKALIPGMPVALNCNMSEEQQKQYIIQLQIEDITMKLRTGTYGIPADSKDRSPSPEPIYISREIKDANRKERWKKKLETERDNLIKQAKAYNPEYKPPIDYQISNGKIIDRVPIPQDLYPHINFIGLIIGPRGNTLKRLENETNCKIIIRGRGSLKDGKAKLGPLPGEDEPLHALLTAANEEAIVKAKEVIGDIIHEGILCPDGSNELRKMQLRELAELNGTLLLSDIIRCKNCGSIEHRHWECTAGVNLTNSVMCARCGGTGHVTSDCNYTGEKELPPGERAKLDDEYKSLLKELGVSAKPKTEAQLSISEIENTILNETNTSNIVQTPTINNQMMANQVQMMPQYYNPMMVPPHPMWNPMGYSMPFMPMFPYQENIPDPQNPPNQNNT